MRSLISRVLWAAAVTAALLAVFAGPACAQGLYQPDVDAALASMSAADWAAAQQAYDAARAAVADFRVASVVEFIKINAWHRAFAGDGAVVHQFTMKSGEPISCIDIQTQRALAASGAALDRLPAADPAASARAAAAFGLDGSPDELGRARRCPAGSFPKVIAPLAHWYRFATLRDIFRKNRDGAKPPAAPALAPVGGVKAPHHYGVVSASSTVNYLGLQADFSLWQVYTQLQADMSLMQLWVTGGSDGGLQTAELGLQHCYDNFSNDNTDLFVYYTADDYQSTGCYNLDCGAFVQTNANVVLGAGFANYSSFGGAPVTLTLAFLRNENDGNWYAWAAGASFGYYPNSLYNSAGLADNGQSLGGIFGGELECDTYGLATLTDMGSGKFPTAGYEYAAFIENMKYVDMSSALQDWTDIASAATDPSYWDVGAVAFSTDRNLSGTSFYLGGPGSTDCSTAVNCSGQCCDANENCVTCGDDDDDDNDDDDDTAAACQNLYNDLYVVCGGGFDDGYGNEIPESTIVGYCEAGEYCMGPNQPYGQCIAENMGAADCTAMSECLGGVVCDDDDNDDNDDDNDNDDNDNDDNDNDDDNDDNDDDDDNDGHADDDNDDHQGDDDASPGAAHGGGRGKAGCGC